MKEIVLEMLRELGLDLKQFGLHCLRSDSASAAVCAGGGAGECCAGIHKLDMLTGLCWIALVCTGQFEGLGTVVTCLRLGPSGLSHSLATTPAATASKFF